MTGSEQAGRGLRRPEAESGGHHASGKPEFNPPDPLHGQSQLSAALRAPSLLPQAGPAQAVMRLERLSSPGYDWRYGETAVPLGDLDGDRLGDFAVSAPGEFGANDLHCDPGEVYVHSGLYRLEGEGINSFFGGSLAAPGDLTGDGVGDLVIGEPACCQPDTYWGCTQSAGPGRINFHDGRTGTLLGQVLPDGLGAYDHRAFGKNLLSIGDLDGDGWSDVLTEVDVVLAGTFPSGDLRHTETVLALDGHTRSPIHRLWNADNELCVDFVSILVSAGDLNNDDFPDWFQSSSCYGDRIYVVSGAPIGVRSRGVPCDATATGRRLRIGATGVPEVGVDYPIHLTGVEAGVRVRLLLGDLKPGRLRMASGGGSVPLVQPVEIHEVLTKDVRPGVAVATVRVPIPNRHALIGTKFYAQWVIPDPAGASTTRVLEIEIQPQDPKRGW